MWMSEAPRCAASSKVSRNKRTAGGSPCRSVGVALLRAKALTGAAVLPVGEAMEGVRSVGAEGAGEVMSPQPALARGCP
jgi:hypothetical protein